jgi:hypothetical protein
MTETVTLLPPTIEGDTPPAVCPEVISLLRAMPIERRAKLTFDLCQAARDLMRAGIRSRNPGLSEQELEIRFKETWKEIYAGMRGRPDE